MRNPESFPSESTSPKEFGEVHEPLPPTEVTPKALELLSSWGFTEEDIGALQEFTAQFRYDLCEEKIGWLADRGAELYEKHGDEYVNFPNFLDTSGRLVGQCGDIARQWIIQMNDTGLIDKLNEKFSGKENGTRKIATMYCWGQSEKFFCTPGSNHVWTGLTAYDTKTKIAEPDQQLYIDASFQTIMTASESKYKEKTAIYDASSVEHNEHMEVELGASTFRPVEGQNGWSWTYNVPQTAVLGVSSRRDYAISLGFVRSDGDTVKPVIVRIHPDGSNSYCMFEGVVDQFVYGPTGSPESEEKEELIGLLRQAQKITITDKPPTRNTVNWKRSDNIMQATGPFNT